MSEYEAELGERGVRFLAVNLYESAEAASAFAESSGHHYEWARAEDDVAERLGINGLPCVIVLDGDGRVAWRSGIATAFRRGRDVREAVEAALAR